MYNQLEHIARTEFTDVVLVVRPMSRRSDITVKLRLLIRDGSYVDVRVNPTGQRYSYHWEQRAQTGQIYRHDNATDHPEVPTYPKHYHNRTEDNVEPSHIPDDPASALRFFLSFVRDRLAEPGHQP